MSFRSTRAVVGAVAGLMFFAGCAEIITYSKKSQETGEQLLRQGRYEEAAGAFRDSTKQNPRNFNSFYYLGVCYDRLGREQQALQSYGTALDVYPANSKDKADLDFREKGVEGLAQCVARSSSRDVEVAKLSARALERRRPMDFYVLARTNAITGDADGAIAAYEQAYLASDRSDARITKSYGMYLTEIGQKERAEPVLTRAYQLDPTDMEVDAALRKIGVVPGPSLLTPEQLHSPLIPKGPIPEFEIRRKENPSAAQPQ